LGIKTVGGMAMLVWQAVKAHEHWYGGNFSTDDITCLIEDANKEMTRIFYEK
jgi:shikimate dehydrogenase